MADTDNAATGKDTKVVITIGGVPKFVFDQIVGFTAAENGDKIETKPLGRDGSKQDHEFVSWSGDIELAVSSNVADAAFNAIQLARQAGAPVVVNITAAVGYRDFTAGVHTYFDCQIGYKSTVKRGQANTITLDWVTGKHRKAL